MHQFHFWLILIMFLIILILHYPQQFCFWTAPETSSWFPLLTRHSLERVLFLIPITYASFIFGLKAGIITTIISAIIMLPRALFISDYTSDSIFEIIGVIVVASIMNYWFYINNQNITLHRHSIKNIHVSSRAFCCI